MKVSGKLHAPATIHPGKKRPTTECIGCWAGPRASLGTVEKKNLQPLVLQPHVHNLPVFSTPTESSWLLEPQLETHKSVH
jgi:hypothetical protein